MRSTSSRLTSSRRPAGEATRHQAAHLGVEQCGIASLPKDGETQHLTRDRLSAMNINIDVSRSPRAPALDLFARGLAALVRASVRYYNDNPRWSASFARWRTRTLPAQTNHISIIPAKATRKRLRFLEETNDLLAPHRREPHEKVSDCFARFEVIEQSLHRNSCAIEHCGAAHHLGATADNWLFHADKTTPIAAQDTGGASARDRLPEMTRAGSRPGALVLGPIQMIQCRVFHLRLPGEGRDLFPRWAPASAGVTEFLMAAWSGVGR